MLTRIRNASRALLPAIELPHSRMKESLAKILKSEGYVAEVSVDGKTIKKLKIQLKYQGKKNVIEGLSPVCANTSARRRFRECSLAWVFRSCPRPKA